MDPAVTVGVTVNVASRPPRQLHPGSILPLSPLLSRRRFIPILRLLYPASYCSPAKAFWPFSVPHSRRRYISICPLSLPTFVNIFVQLRLFPIVYCARYIVFVRKIAVERERAIVIIFSNGNSLIFSPKKIFVLKTAPVTCF